MSTQQNDPRTATPIQDDAPGLTRPKPTAASFAHFARAGFHALNLDRRSGWCRIGSPPCPRLGLPQDRHVCPTSKCVQDFQGLGTGRARQNCRCFDQENYKNQAAGGPRPRDASVIDLLRFRHRVLFLKKIRTCVAGECSPGKGGYFSLNDGKSALLTSRIPPDSSSRCPTH
jgi:hypothetical protein